MLLSAPFLVELETQNFVNNLRDWRSRDPPASREISLVSEVCLPDSSTATQLCQRFHQYAHCVCRCPDACRLFWTSPQQPIDAVLRPTFVHKLCYKLPSVVTFTFLQTFGYNYVLFTERRQSCRVCLIQCQNSRYFRCPKNLIKNKPTWKLNHANSIDFWIFLPNNIKIDRYNFELYRFKVGPFFWDTV